MMDRDELNAVRWELDQLLKKAAVLDHRLADLEGRSQEAPAEPLPAPPPPQTPPVALQFGPPPLPARVLTQPEPVPAPEFPAEAPAPRPLLPPEPPKPNPLLVALKKLGPREEMSWEMALGTWWIPRIGALLLVLGVVGLLAWAIDEFGSAWWMPYFRLALGYGICATLLVTGKRVEARFTNFARVLLSGGIALSYFVTFATYYVPFARVFPRPEPTLLLLTGVVIAWTAVAQYRKSPLVACAVTLLGQLTVAVSTLSLDTPSRFAVVGLIALSAVSAYFLARNRWYWVAATGMVGSYLNHLFWLVRSPASTEPLDCFVALAVLAVYFLLFAGAEILAPEGLRRREVSLRLRSLYAAFNTAAFLYLGREIMLGFEFSAPYTHVFYFTLAAVLAGLAFGYWLRRANDPLHNLYFTKAASIATLGFAVWLDGATLTATLAVETVVLLMGARRSGLLVSRLLAHACGLLAFGHGIAVLADTDWSVIAYSSSEFPAMAAAAVVTVLAFLATSLLYQRTDWIPRSPDTAPNLKNFLDWLWKLDLLAVSPDAALVKPLEGLLFPSIYALAAAILGILNAAVLLDAPHQAPAVALLALGLLLASTPLRSRPFADASLVWGLAAAVFWAFAAVDMRSEFLNRLDSYGQPAHSQYVVCALFTLLPLLALAEMERFLLAASHLSWRAGARKTGIPIPVLYALCAYCVIVAAAIALVREDQWALVFALAAALSAAYACIQPAPAFGLLALVASVTAAVLPGRNLDAGTSGIWAGTALILLMAPALFGERRYAGNRPGLRPLQLSFTPYLLYGALAWLYRFQVLKHYYGDVQEARLLLAGALLFAAAAWRLHRPATGVWSVFLLAIAFANWNFQSYEDLDFAFYLIPCCAVPLGLAMDRWFHHLDGPALRMQRILALVVVWCFLLRVVPTGVEDKIGDAWIYGALGLLAFTWLGWAAFTRELAALVLGILAASVGTVALLIRAYEEGLPAQPLVFGFAAIIAFWLLIERLYTRGLRDGLLPAVLRAETWKVYLVALPCVLLLVMFERMPTLGQYFLTISWTASAVAIFVLGRVTSERYYRYAALLVFLLATGRLFFFDLSGLAPLYRVLAFMFLGAVLLGISYAYLLDRQRTLRQNQEQPPPSEN